MIHKRALLLIGLLLVLSVSVLAIPPASATASMLSGWSYRKSHIINNSAGAGTKYQISLTVYYTSGSDSGSSVYTAGKCQTDFDDIRFTDDDGFTLLDYWLKSKTDSNNGVFWIEIADSLESSPATIYIYYGNAGASSISNFDATFIFGDPFDSSSLNTTRWPSVDAMSYTISATNHYIEVTNMNNDGWYLGQGFHSKVFTFPAQYIIEDAYASTGQKISHSTDSTGELCSGMFAIDDSALGNGELGLFHWRINDGWAATANYQLYSSVGATSWTSGAQAGSTGVFYDCVGLLKKLGSYVSIYIGGTLRVNATDSTTPDRIHLSSSKFPGYGFGTERYYSFKIRKYCVVEPAHSTYGAEEGINFHIYYNSTFGSVFINGTFYANASTYSGLYGSIASLFGAPNNSSYSFLNFNSTVTTNPYLYTLTGIDVIIWCNFGVASGSASWRAIAVISAILGLFAFAMYMLSKK